MLRPSRALPPLTEVSLRTSPLIADTAGRRLLANTLPTFATGAAADDSPPRVQARRVQVADACLVVRVRASEVTDLELSPRWGEPARASIGMQRHEIGLPLGGPMSGEARLVLVDLAGNRTQVEAVRLKVPPLPRIVISEVLANPLGPEPAQEWVELVNRGARAVNLTGWTLDDGDDGVGVAVLPSGQLSPGKHAIVVGHRYQPLASVEPVPDAKAVVLRLAGTLGALGLANTGETLALRRSDGTPISSYGGYAQAAGKLAGGRSIVRVDDKGCDTKDNWRVSLRDPTPGR